MALFGPAAQRWCVFVECPYLQLRTQWNAVAGGRHQAILRIAHGLMLSCAGTIPRANRTSSSGASHEQARSADSRLERNILGFAGIAPVNETLIGMTGNMEPEAVKKWLAKPEKLGKQGN